MTDIDKEIGRKLKGLRKQKKWSQKDAGKALGISSPTYLRIEKGRFSITIDRLFKASEAYNVPIFYFMADSPEIIKQLATPLYNTSKQLKKNTKKLAPLIQQHLKLLGKLEAQARELGGLAE